MATYYWVAGNGTWDNANNVHWATSSGGAGGAGVPTTADDVIFDASSNAAAYTVTCGSTAAAANVTINNPTTGAVSLTGGSITFTGNWYNTAQTTFSVGYPAGSPTLTYTGSGNSTFNHSGTNFTTMTINCTGKLTLMANNSSGQWTHAAGTFDTNGYNMSPASGYGGGFVFSGSGAKTIILGSSNIYWYSSDTNLGATNLTTVPGTSKFWPGTGLATSIFNSGGHTWYELRSGTYMSGSFTINGTNNFTNAYISGPVTISHLNCTGTLYTNYGSSSAASRTTIKSPTIGVQANITAANVVLTNTDFIDVKANGAASWTGTNIGDAGGNSGINFPAPKTVYWVGNGTSFGSNCWSLTSGGSVEANNFPLPQDTAIFDDNSYPTVISLSTGVYHLPSIDSSSRTKPLTISYTGKGSFNFDGSICGNTIYGPGVTVTGGDWHRYRGRANAPSYLSSTSNTTITYPFDIYMQGANNSLNLLSAFTSSSSISLSLGRLNCNNYTLTTTSFSSSGSSTRYVDFGDNGGITVTGTGTILDFSTSTNLNITGNGTITTTSTGSTAITVNPGVTTKANTMSFAFTGGTYALTFLNNSGTNVRDVSFAGFGGSLASISTVNLYGNLICSSTMTWPSGGSITLKESYRSTNTSYMSSNNILVNTPITIDAPGNTIKMTDNFLTGASNTFTLTNGTLDMNGKKFTAGSFTTGSGTKSITFNAGTLELFASGSTVFNNGNPTNFTSSAGTGTGKISMLSSSAKTFVGGGSTYACELNQAGTGELTITGNNSFLGIYANQVGNIAFTASTTQTLTNRFAVSGSTATKIAIKSTVAGTKHTLSLANGTVRCINLDIKDSTATGGATWYAGSTSTNNGNNTGWTFSNAPSATSNSSFLGYFR